MYMGKGFLFYANLIYVMIFRNALTAHIKTYLATFHTISELIFQMEFLNFTLNVLWVTKKKKHKVHLESNCRTPTAHSSMQRNSNSAQLNVV